MVSEDKLIRQGIRKTDAWFNRFKKRISQDLALCDTYKEFVEGGEAWQYLELKEQKTIQPTIS